MGVPSALEASTRCSPASGAQCITPPLGRWLLHLEGGGAMFDAWERRGEPITFGGHFSRMHKRVLGGGTLGDLRRGSGDRANVTLGERLKRRGYATGGTRRGYAERGSIGRTASGAHQNRRAWNPL